MKPKLIVVVNNTAEVEYDREKPVEPRQLAALDRMDQMLDRGIELAGRTIDHPDVKLRAHFVASNLVQALRDENGSSIALLTAYLAVRLPELRQIRITEQDGGLEIDLNYSGIDANAVPIAIPGKLN
jgi:hypothetical protein